MSDWQPIVHQERMCGHTRETRNGHELDCDERAVFVRTMEDGASEFACGKHARSPADAPVPGGPPMREGNNPRTGIAWNE